jgi:hypothetical protein
MKEKGIQRLLLADRGAQTNEFAHCRHSALQKADAQTF